MSFPITDIVNSNVTRATKSVTQAGFGTALLVTEADDGSPPFAGRVKEYANKEDAATDGFILGTYVYDSLNKIFSQNPSPETVKVGLKYITTTPDASWTAALTAIRQVDTEWYGLTIESEVLADQKEVADFTEGTVNPPILYGIRSDDLNILNYAGESPGYQDVANSGTVGAFPAGIVAAIATQVDYELDITIDGVLSQIATISIAITDTWAGIAAAIQVALRAATASTETVAIVDGNIRVTSVTLGATSTVLVAGGTAGTGSGDLFIAINALGTTYVVDVQTAIPGNEDIALYIQGLSYERSFVSYNSGTNSEYIDAGIFGKQFPVAPGSSTWKFKTIAGVTAESTMTTDQRSKALAKNCNIHIERGGNIMYEEGTVGVGEFIDIIRGIDWQDSIIEQNIFAPLINTPKLPITDPGIAVIEGQLLSSLIQGATAGLLVRESIVVNVPLAADIPTADKAARNVTGITWSADLQGAIHFTKPINGTVSV